MPGQVYIPQDANHSKVVSESKVAPINYVSSSLHCHRCEARTDVETHRSLRSSRPSDPSFSVSARRRSRPCPHADLFAAGYDSGIIGSVVSKSYTHFHNYFSAHGSVDDNIIGAIVSVFAGGCFFGALLAGFTANKIGRKRTIQFGCVIAIVGKHSLGYYGVRSAT